MSDQELIITIKNKSIAIVTLNKPKLHNAFDDALVKTLTTELQALDANPVIRVVMLNAVGKSFSAGADLNWMRKMAHYTKEENVTDAEGLAQLMYTLNNLSKPTIAVVQGATFGGGVGLVACCDIAIASRSASFCLSEVKLGLVPAVISPYVINAIGERAARRYFLTAERFSVEEAFRLGLVHAVVVEGQLQSAGEQMAMQMLTNSPKAMTTTKRLIAEVANKPVCPEIMRKTAECIAEMRVSDEGREGITAFLEKRPAAWVEPQ